MDISILIDIFYWLWIYIFYYQSLSDRIILSEILTHLQKETIMKKDVKKLLASLGVASLISAGGITLPGAHAAGSG